MSSQDDCNTGKCPNNECFDIVKSKKTVTVPCTRNICESYTVKVPKMKSVTVNKQVPYTDYETRTKQVPYQYLERQTVVRKVPTCRTVPVTQNVCTTIRRNPLASLLSGGRSCYKKKCPRTVYVTKRCCEPRQFCQSVPKTGWKTIQEKVPVQKMKNIPEVQYKTEYVPEVRRRTRQVTKMVTKTVPVYNIVPKPPPSPGKERVIETVRAPEPNRILPAQTVVQTFPTVQSNAVQTSAVPINAGVAAYSQTSAVPINAGVAAYSPGYYVPVHNVAYVPRREIAQVAYINPGSPNQYGVQQNGMCTGVLARNGNLEQSLGFQEVKLDPAMTNDMGAINLNYESGYGVQETGRSGYGAQEAGRSESGYEVQPSVAFETPVRNTEEALTYSNRAGDGTEFCQRRL